MGNIESRRELIEKLCADTWKELYRFIYYKVQNREEAQDITQETYAKAISFLLKNEITVQESSNYLKTISMNIIRDQWRAKKRRGSLLNLEEVNPEDFAAEDFTDSVTSKAELVDAIQCLSEDQQAVITLRIIKGYSVADTARLMKRKEGMVRVLQFRALKELAKLLQPVKKKEETR